MKWNGIEASWKQLKDAFASRPFRLSDHDSPIFDLIGAGLSGTGRGDESPTTVFRPDDREKRSEFSLHIGC
jgi:hypothetical protein